MTLFLLIVLMIILLVGTVFMALGRGKSAGELPATPRLRKPK